MARPMEAIEPSAYIHNTFGKDAISGTFTLSLIAHDPLARMDIVSVDDPALLEEDNGFLRNHTGLLPTSMLPPLDHSGAVGKTKQFLLYNPGNERTPLGIHVAGDVGEDGLLVHSRNTGQRCKIVKLTKALTTSVGAYLDVDAERGRTALMRNGAATLAYMYHDLGYIELIGASPIDRDLTFTYSKNERKAICKQPLRVDMVGRYAYLQNRWVLITAITDDNTMSVDYTFGQNGMETACVAAMNEIVLTTASGLTLDMLKFTYQPRYR